MVRNAEANIKLNLGCGLNVVDGWINVDYALGAKFVKFPFFSRLNKKFGFFTLDWSDQIYIYDLRKKFPWKDNVVDVVYSSHTLEHFTRVEGYNFLKECHRVLRSGGTLRIIVPDLSCLVKDYSDGKIRADIFLERLGVLYKSNDNLLNNVLIYFISFPHKCMYDALTLLTILKNIGFLPELKKAFDSEIEDIAMIELEERSKNAVIIEGIKK